MTWAAWTKVYVELCGCGCGRFAGWPRSLLPYRDPLGRPFLWSSGGYYVDKTGYQYYSRTEHKPPYKRE